MILVGDCSATNHLHEHQQRWETAEYVRDARTKGDNISLILLGHIASEEPGSEFMLNWLKEKVPSVKSTHIPSGNSLSFL